MFQQNSITIESRKQVNILCYIRVHRYLRSVSFHVVFDAIHLRTFYLCLCGCWHSGIDKLVKILLLNGSSGGGCVVDRNDSY